MEHSHLSIETLAKWLAGRLEHDDVLREVVPHLLASCPVCRQRSEDIRRLQEEVGHWDEEVAVLEGPEAVDLLARLEAQPFEEQVRLAGEDESFQTWGLCQLLLRKSLEAVFDAPAKALDRADLAVRISHHLGRAYHPEWVLDLRARSLAYLGNARRVLGELRSSESAFRRAEACLGRSQTGNPKIEAEILDLKSSLRLDQLRFPEAQDLSDRALQLYRKVNDSHGIGISLIKRAKTFREMQKIEQAIQLLEEGTTEIDRFKEPRLFAYLRFNLLGCLALASRNQEALDMLPEVRALLRAHALPVDLVRLRWAEGSIAFGLGQIEEAEVAFREVQRAFLDRGMDYNAALVSLDLAVLLSQEGRTAELKRLAIELMAAFEAREIYREAAAALLLFQRACEEEQMTAELARQIAGMLRERRRE
ncbi:MAG TPA: tetratricopeptide repeat protein [Thermoanaerobaculia bacterium]|nr:tetratricopeptide repeat protein [Thermoanaerobaculia bacterium]